jgi:hypothetical protein
MVEQSRRKPAAGVYRGDLVRIGQALEGVAYPAQKWQLIAHATRATPDNDRQHHTDRRTVHQLWALPSGRYGDFTDVRTGLAWTSRGHPARSETLTGRRS